MPINPRDRKYHYMSQQDLLDKLRRELGGFDVRVHETVGHYGDMSCLTQSDLTKGYTSEDDRAILSLNSYMKDELVQAVIIPMHRPYKGAKNKHYEGADHWDGYVLLRDANGTMQALRLTTPGDGYCGGHFIYLASELVNHGLDAFRRGPHAQYLQSLSAEGFSEDIATDAAQLVSIGAELLDAKALAPLTPAARKCVSFGANDVREFDQKAPASSVGKLEQSAKAAREAAGFAPIPKELVVQVITKSVANPSALDAGLTADELRNADFVMQHYVLDIVFRQIVGYQNLDAERHWIGLQVPGDKIDYLAELADEAGKSSDLSDLLAQALQEARQEQKAYQKATATLSARLHAPVDHVATACHQEVDVADDSEHRAVVVV